MNSMRRIPDGKGALVQLRERRALLTRRHFLRSPAPLRVMGQSSERWRTIPDFMKSGILPRVSAVVTGWRAAGKIAELANSAMFSVTCWARRERPPAVAGGRESKSKVAPVSPDWRIVERAVPMATRQWRRNDNHACHLHPIRRGSAPRLALKRDCEIVTQAMNEQSSKLKARNSKNVRTTIGRCLKKGKETKLFLRMVVAAEAQLADEARLLYREAHERLRIFGTMQKR